jgi:hypothetical protein
MNQDQVVSLVKKVTPIQDVIELTGTRTLPGYSVVIGKDATGKLLAAFVGDRVVHVQDLTGFSSRDEILRRYSASSASNKAGGGGRCT